MGEQKFNMDDLETIVYLKGAIPSELFHHTDVYGETAILAKLLNKAKSYNGYSGHEWEETCEFVANEYIASRG